MLRKDAEGKHSLSSMRRLIPSFCWSGNYDVDVADVRFRSRGLQIFLFAKRRAGCSGSTTLTLERSQIEPECVLLVYLRENSQTSEMGSPCQAGRALFLFLSWL